MPNTKPFFTAAALTAVLLAAAVFISCGGKSALYEDTYEAGSARAPAEMKMSADNYEEQVPANTAQSGRKLIKTGSLYFKVNDIAQTEIAVAKWCALYGGYVESSFNNENSGSAAVRIPSARFEQAMESAGSIGTLESKSVSAEDVSERYYDLQTRLETRKLMRSRLQTYLSQAKNMEDMLKIEHELNSVIADIESMEGKMKRLSSQIDYSRIEISYHLPFRATSSGGFEWPDMGEAFRRFASNIVDFFAGLLTVLLYIVICGAPLVGIAALLYWLLFGKIGLLKKLFRLLNGKGK